MPNKGFKSGKSSKTARVLNLLTDPESAETAVEPAPAVISPSDREPVAIPRPALSGPTRPQEPLQAHASVSVTPAVMPDFSREAEDMPEPAFSAPTQPQTPLQAHMEQLRTAGEQEPDEYICFNVTQALVEDKADKYIKMFGLCGCNRCRIDVIALALSNLPAKYVVAKPHELIPRLSMYEQKYNAAVVTQVMSACRKVLDRPHHERSQT